MMYLLDAGYNDCETSLFLFNQLFKCNTGVKKLFIKGLHSRQPDARAKRPWRYNTCFELQSLTKI